MTDEDFYDVEIAPILKDLMLKCEERGMAFLSVVAFDGIIGRTVCIPEKSPLIFRYLNSLAQCNISNNSVNIDAFMLGVGNDARQNGHSSIVLTQMGIPMEPIK